MLAGRWRETRDEALRDAVNANQAQLDAGAPEGLRWVVDGKIEEQSTADELARR